MIIETNLLLLFMIAAAVIAVEAKDLLSSVVAVGAVGLGLSMAFLLLKAPDLAITQLVVELLCLIILIRATIRKDLPFSASGRWLFNTLGTLSFIAVFLFTAYLSLKNLPQFGGAVMRVAQVYVKDALARTGAANVVAAIILDFRGYDTLGEATVLFTAVIGVLAIVRRIGRKRETQDESR
jgi:multisubunit Na+/H+ antiporter MnhB subunit